MPDANVVLIRTITQPSYDIESKVEPMIIHAVFDVQCCGDAAPCCPRIATCGVYHFLNVLNVAALVIADLVLESRWKEH